MMSDEQPEPDAPHRTGTRMRSTPVIEEAQKRDAKRKAASRDRKAMLAEAERIEIESLRGEQARLKAEAAKRRGL